jgi:hypothetical protein
VKVQVLAPWLWPHALHLFPVSWTTPGDGAPGIFGWTAEWPAAAFGLACDGPAACACPLTAFAWALFGCKTLGVGWGRYAGGAAGVRCRLNARGGCAAASFRCKTFCVGWGR